MIVSSCPTTSQSFVKSHTIIESGHNGIDQIVIESTIDPTTYQPGNILWFLYYEKLKKNYILSEFRVLGCHRKNRNGYCKTTEKIALIRTFNDPINKILKLYRQIE